MVRRLEALGIMEIIASLAVVYSYYAEAHSPEKDWFFWLLCVLVALPGILMIVISRAREGRTERDWMQKTARRFMVVFGTLFSVSVPLVIVGTLYVNELVFVVGFAGVMAGLCWIGYRAFFYLWLKSYSW